MTDFSWNDAQTPRVHFTYDAASRQIGITNYDSNNAMIADISRSYYNDNLLYLETETITGGYAKSVTSTYDADGNRGSTTYPAPENYAFGYSYTGRNQLSAVNGWATYTYDENNCNGSPCTGHLTKRTLSAGPYTTYNYDGLDRVTGITHTFSGDSRSFNYGYDDANHSDNLKYTRRLPQDVGDVFKYDVADQTIGVQLNVPTPQNVQSIDQTIVYDANGNRNWFGRYGLSEQYWTNNLSQYTSVTIWGDPSFHGTANYDNNGNLILSPYPMAGQLASTYDAQNRLTQATRSGATISFKYDGLNRQVSRSVNNGTPTFNIWDGWDLIEEYQAANNGSATATYLYGTTGLIRNEFDASRQDTIIAWAKAVKREGRVHRRVILEFHEEIPRSKAPDRVPRSIEF